MSDKFSLHIYISINQYVNSGFTIVNGICACANLLRLVAIILAIVSTDSIVHPAMCGVSMKFRSFSNLSLGSGGSSQNTSNAAPDILLLYNAVNNASLSTIAARATFTRNDVFFIKPNSFGPIIFLVCSVRGQCKEI